MRYRFPAALADEVRALAAAEAACCSFLRFDVANVDNGVVLTVESDGWAWTPCASSSTNSC
jgi:hypothetical protein